MAGLDLTGARWHKSSHSSANGQCVETAHRGHRKSGTMGWAEGQQEGTS